MYTPYKIIEKRSISEKCEKDNCIILLKLKPADENGKVFSYKPGQFAMFEIDRIRRAYSIASEPSMNYLEFAIHLIGGKMTSKLAEMIKGDIINVAGPFGNHFIYKEQTNVGFMGAGAGVTPLISIIRYIHKNKIPGNFILFYTAKTLEFMPYYKELKQISEQNKDIIFVPTLTRVDKEKMPNWTSEFGRINKRMIEKYVDNSAKQKTWFICGSMGFIGAMKEMLIQLGVEKNKILFEGWG